VELGKDVCLYRTVSELASGVVGHKAQFDYLITLEV